MGVSLYIRAVIIKGDRLLRVCLSKEEAPLHHFHVGVLMVYIKLQNKQLIPVSVKENTPPDKKTG